MVDLNRRDSLVPIVQASRSWAGTVTVGEMDLKVMELEGLVSDETLQRDMPLIARLSFTRGYLKQCGYGKNAERGTGKLTELGLDSEVDPAVIMRCVGPSSRYRSCHSS